MILFLSRLPQMLFHDEILQVLRTIVNVCHKKKIQSFWYFFCISLFTWARAEKITSTRFMVSLKIYCLLGENMCWSSRWYKLSRFIRCFILNFLLAFFFFARNFLLAFASILTLLLGNTGGKAKEVNTKWLGLGFRDFELFNIALPWFRGEHKYGDYWKNLALWVSEYWKRFIIQIAQSLMWILALTHH